MIGLYGGSFDPLHIGHLRTALEIQQALALTEIRFLPAGNPPHRERPRATNTQRLEMLAAALADQPGFQLDARELDRDGPSFTVNTLESLREDFPEATLLLIVGMDAFLQLMSWHRWSALFELAHLVVAHRPGWQPPDSGPLGDLLMARASAVRKDFLHGSGRIFVQAVTALEIASSDIRAAVARDEDIRYLVPDCVQDIIQRSGCYLASNTLTASKGDQLSAK